MMYNGKSGNDSGESASLNDTIPMGGLAPDIKVQELMDTEGGDLCYTY